MELRSLRERLKMRVAAELDLTRDVEDAEIARMIDRCILEETKDQYVPLKEKVGLRVELFNSLRRLDVLTELLEDETVTDGTRKIEIPLYSVEWLKMGLSATSIFLRIPSLVANKSRFISF